MSDKELEKQLKTYRPVQDPIKAEEYLSDMCRGIRHSMSIPPRVDDWDMVFSRVIERAKLLDNTTSPVSESEAYQIFEDALESYDGNSYKLLLTFDQMKKISRALRPC